MPRYLTVIDKRLSNSYKNNLKIGRNLFLNFYEYVIYFWRNLKTIIVFELLILTLFSKFFRLLSVR